MSLEVRYLVRGKYRLCHTLLQHRRRNASTFRQQHQNLLEQTVDREDNQRLFDQSDHASSSASFD